MTCELPWLFSWTALCLVTMVFIPVLSKPPSLKWAQDADNVFVTVSVDCGSNKVVGSKPHIFELSCIKKNGESVTVNFNLREAVKANLTTCKSVRGEEDCKLVKLHRHYFDRLTKDADELKAVLKPDWTRWIDTEEGPTENSDYEGVEAVKQVTIAELDTEFKKGTAIVADVSFPWCSHCTFIRKGYISAAKKLASDKHKFVWIDARENFEAVSRSPTFTAYRELLFSDPVMPRFNVTCDHKCVLQVLFPGEPAVTIEAKGNEKDILEHIQAHLAPALTAVDSDEAYQAFRTAHPVHALALLQSKESAEYAGVEVAARGLRGKLAVAWASRDMAGFRVPSIQVVGNLSEARGVKPSGDGVGLRTAMLAESLPLLDDYSWNKRELYDGLGLPVVHVFIDAAHPEAEAQRELARGVAKEVRGRMGMVLFGKTDEYMLKDFGLGDGMPALGVANNFSYNSVKMGYEGAFTHEGILAFLHDVLKGAVPPSFKSETVPPEAWASGSLNKLVAKAVSPLVASPSAALVLLYKPWAAGVEAARAAAGKLAEAVGGVEGVVVGAMDGSKNHVDPAVWGQLDPDNDLALFAVPGHGAPPVRHAGRLGLKEMLQFAARRVGVVRAGWESTVKGRLKEMKARDAEAKRAAAEAAAARAEEERRLEETLAGAEKVEVGEARDGGVLKQVIRAGEGGTPAKGDRVRAHYTGTLESGEKFDSSRDRGDPFAFTLGQGQVIKCWDQAFATMKKGERAMLTCTAPYAYGDRGSPPKIPAGATLRFDVELLSFGRDEL